MRNRMLCAASLLAIACGARTGLLEDVDASGTDAGQPSAPCIAMLDAGHRHACFARGDGSVWCWGGNHWGELGTGKVGGGYCKGECVSVPERAALDGRAVSLSAGSSHTCAALADGTAWCWGDNLFGEVGDGTFEGAFCGSGGPQKGQCRPSPVRVTGLSSVIAVAAGGSHTCAIRADGTAWCWGVSQFGALGNGSKDGMPCNDSYKCVPTPVQVVAPGIQWAQLVVGHGHTCGRTTQGEVYCWGETTRGQCAALGSSIAIPQRVDAIGQDALEVAAGDYHTCVRKTDGSMWCWGWNKDSQLASSIGQACQDGELCNPTPAKISELGNFTIGMTLGAYHSCARTSDQRLWCWGFGNNGELGRYVTGSDPIPKPASAAGLLSTASAGDSFTCGVKLDGTLWCWGLANEWQPPVLDGSMPGPFQGLPPIEIQVDCPR